MAHHSIESGRHYDSKPQEKRAATFDVDTALAEVIDELFHSIYGGQPEPKKPRPLIHYDNGVKVDDRP